MVFPSAPAEHEVLTAVRNLADTQATVLYLTRLIRALDAGNPLNSSLRAELAEQIGVRDDQFAELTALITPGPVQENYGVRYRRSGRMHRTNMTEDEARAFMDPADWGDLDPNRVFEIVRRTNGPWIPV